MNREQYQAWSVHPQTVQFFQYLKDYRADLMERWASGVIQDNNNIAAVSRCQMADEIANLEDTAIEEFYRNRKEETNA